MKIKRKRLIKTEETVYDITVPKTHNFLLEAGVFTHNCDHPDSVIGGWADYNKGITVAGSKDTSDSSCQVIYSIFTNPIQTNIMDIASSITRQKYPDKDSIPLNYNIPGRMMSHRKATELALKMFNKS